MSFTAKPFRRGLVVGKFCPLHKGHELVIQRAIDECDEVLVISYSKPEFKACEAAARRTWLATIFPNVTTLVIDDASLEKMCGSRNIHPAIEVPHNDAPENLHRTFVAWLCWDVLENAVDAVFTSEDYGDGFAAVLSRYFRNRSADAATVRHICVDKQRGEIPISGTQIRADPHCYSEYLSPKVREKFVKTICFLGAESTGKTTLAAALSSHLRTVWVSEYGRELWVLQDGKLQFDDLLHIGKTQVMHELESFPQADKWLVCDTSPLTTLFYSVAMFGKASPELTQLATREYDVVFLCAPDFDFVQDGTRQDESFRARQHAWYLHELEQRKMCYCLLRGSVETRIATASDYLRQYATDITLSGGLTHDVFLPLGN